MKENAIVTSVNKDCCCKNLSLNCPSENSTKTIFNLHKNCKMRFLWRKMLNFSSRQF